jgi:signal peptidase I
VSTGATKSHSGSGSLLELVLIVATALALALAIQAFLVKPYRIPSPSMEPTLAIGQRVLVNRLGNRFSQPEVGEIMVFHPPAGAEEASQCANPGEGQGEAAPCSRSTQRRADVNFIKRVVGVPGDRISIRNGRVVRNGVPAREPFVRPCEGEGGCDFPQEITVPPGHYFMMGDNRGASDDSRFWGPVRRDWLIGGAFATYWPPGRIGLL